MSDTFSCDIFQLLVSLKRITKSQIQKKYGNVGISELNKILAQGYFVEDLDGGYKLSSGKDFLYYGHSISLKLIKNNIEKYDKTLSEFNTDQHRVYHLKKEVAQEYLRKKRELEAWLDANAKETEDGDVVFTTQTITREINFDL